MHGARQYVALTELRIPEDGTRAGATMAVLVEEARWRTSARGKRYMMATLSDASGQFVATCFDDGVAADLEEAARCGGCGLITVELDRRPGEETPRVSVKRIQPFEGLAAHARFTIEARVANGQALDALAALLAQHRGARGEVRARLAVDGGEAIVLLGRDFLLDLELVEAIQTIPGISDVALDRVASQLRSVG